VTAEVTPHHLFLTEDDIESYDTNLKMNPPLRTAEDAAALLEGLLDGTIDCIATDHAPHAAHEKELEFEEAPFGTTGLETALPLVITRLVAPGTLDWTGLVRVLATGPRECLGLDAVALEEGAPADITVIDPEAEVEARPGYFESRSSNSAFLGETLHGAAREVVAAGRVALLDGQVVDG
jgi:dihydroorotase